MTHQRATPMTLSIPEIAHSIGVSERQIWKMIASDELHSFKIGKRRFITTTELQRFIDQKSKP